MKLNRFLITSFVFIGLLSGLLVGAFNYYRSVQLREHDAMSELLAIGKLRADYIENYILRLITEAELIATQQTLSDEELQRMTGLAQGIEGVFVLDAAGDVVATSGKIPHGTNHAEQLPFLAGKTRTTFFPKNYSSLSGEYVMVVATPFHDGVLVVLMNTQAVEDIVKDKTGLGETGEVLVAIQNGDQRISLFDRLFESDALTQSVENENTAEPMKQALLGNEVTFSSALDYRNEPVIAVSQYITTGNIGLVAKIDRAEIVGVYKKEYLRNAFISGIMILFITILFGSVVALRISNPINRLIRAMDAISESGFGTKVEEQLITSQNEIGQMAKVFNHMIDRLQESKNEVDMKVHEQTKEIVEQQKKTKVAMQDLEEINKAMVGRELKMVELKKEIERLKRNNQ